jgi:hypothetical protein
MSRAGILVVAVLLLGAAPDRTRAADAAPATPPLEAIAPRFDAGRVEAGTPVRHTFVLRNRGTQTLQILAKASCGCTTTDYDHQIAPGTTGEVGVLLDTTHMRGPVEKTIDVSTNDPNQPVIVLYLAADSQRALLVEPYDEPLLRGPVHLVQPAVVTVRTRDDAAFRITRVEDEPSLRAALVPLDPSVRGAHRLWQVTLTPNRDLAVGSYHPNVTSRANAARFELRPTVIVTGPLLTIPTALHVGPGITTVRVRVTASDGVAFRMLAAECSDPDFTATFAPVDGEFAYDVTVRYTGKPGRHGPVNAVVKLTTDAPSQPLVVVRLAGKL